LLGLFALLAVAPLLTVGVFDYVRSRRLIENLIATQTDTVVRRAAETIHDRYAMIASDILLLSENADVQRFLRVRATGDSVRIRAARDTATRFLEAAWHVDSSTYYAAEWRDRSGDLLFRLSNDAESDVKRYDPSITVPLRDVERGQVVGSLMLGLRTQSLFSATRFGPVFGRTGDLLVIDRTSGRVIQQLPGVSGGPTARDRIGAAWSEIAGTNAATHGTLRYAGPGDTVRIATYVNLAEPAWTVLSSTAVAEFAGAFDRTRALDALSLLILAAAVAVAFALLVSRATHSLEQLTQAAAIVAQGDLSPSLPQPADDEVGTLSRAFAYMVERVRSMMREIAVSRQLAVIGEFAAQLSHEVRNPLTSMKLDLQGMQRQVRAGVLDQSTGPAIESALREINRLDSVVHGVLELARQAPISRRQCSVHDAVDRAVAAVHAQLEARNIRAEQCLRATFAEIDGDPDLLTGLFINLLLNGSDAQPNGGAIGILSSNRDVGGTRWIDVTVADDGPGIADDRREDVFRPFYTSRHDGTGLGLPLAVRTAREHGGHLDIGVTPVGFTGAAFVVSLPVRT
jgi:signal transduction histidine kinase